MYIMHGQLSWFQQMPRNFATCSVTEVTLLRMHMMAAPDSSAAAAWNTLSMLRRMTGHEFWEAGFSYEEVKPKGVMGHRQVTDAWLAELARKRGGKLATLDAGLVQAHGDVAELIPQHMTEELANKENVRK